MWCLKAIGPIVKNNNPVNFCSLSYYNWSNLKFHKRFFVLFICRILDVVYLQVFPKNKIFSRV